MGFYSNYTALPTGKDNGNNNNKRKYACIFIAIVVFIVLSVGVTAIIALQYFTPNIIAFTSANGGDGVTPEPPNPPVFGNETCKILEDECGFITANHTHEEFEECGGCDPEEVANILKNDTAFLNATKGDTGDCEECGGCDPEEVANILKNDTAFLNATKGDTGECECNETSIIEKLLDNGDFINKTTGECTCSDNNNNTTIIINGTVEGNCTCNTTDIVETLKEDEEFLNLTKGDTGKDGNNGTQIKCADELYGGLTYIDAVLQKPAAPEGTLCLDLSTGTVLYRDANTWEIWIDHPHPIFYYIDNVTKIIYIIESIGVPVIPLDVVCYLQPGDLFLTTDDGILWKLGENSTWDDDCRLGSDECSCNVTEIADSLLNNTEFLNATKGETGECECNETSIIDGLLNNTEFLNATKGETGECECNETSIVDNLLNNTEFLNATKGETGNDGFCECNSTEIVTSLKNDTEFINATKGDTGDDGFCECNSTEIVTSLKNDTEFINATKGDTGDDGFCECNATEIINNLLNNTDFLNATKGEMGLEGNCTCNITDVFQNETITDFCTENPNATICLTICFIFPTAPECINVPFPPVVPPGPFPPDFRGTIFKCTDDVIVGITSFNCSDIGPGLFDGELCMDRTTGFIYEWDTISWELATPQPMLEFYYLDEFLGIIYIIESTPASVPTLKFKCKLTEGDILLETITGVFWKLLDDGTWADNCTLSSTASCSCNTTDVVNNLLNNTEFLNATKGETGECECNETSIINNLLNNTEFLNATKGEDGFCECNETSIINNLLNNTEFLNATKGDMGLEGNCTCNVTDVLGNETIVDFCTENPNATICQTICVIFPTAPECINVPFPPVVPPGPFPPELKGTVFKCTDDIIDGITSFNCTGEDTGFFDGELCMDRLSGFIYDWDTISWEFSTPQPTLEFYYLDLDTSVIYIIETTPKSPETLKFQCDLAEGDILLETNTGIFWKLLNNGMWIDNCTLPPINETELILSITNNTLFYESIINNTDFIAILLPAICSECNGTTGGGTIPPNATCSCNTTNIIDNLLNSTEFLNATKGETGECECNETSIINNLLNNTGFLNATKGDTGDTGDDGFCECNSTEIITGLKNDTEFLNATKGDTGDTGECECNETSIIDNLLNNTEFLNATKGETGDDGFCECNSTEIITNLKNDTEFLNATKGDTGECECNETSIINSLLNNTEFLNATKGDKGEKGEPGVCEDDDCDDIDINNIMVNTTENISVSCNCTTNTSYTNLCKPNGLVVLIDTTKQIPKSLFGVCILELEKIISSESYQLTGEQEDSCSSGNSVEDANSGGEDCSIRFGNELGTNAGDQAGPAGYNSINFPFPIVLYGWSFSSTQTVSFTGGNVLDILAIRVEQASLEETITIVSGIQDTAPWHLSDDDVVVFMDKGDYAFGYHNRGSDSITGVTNTFWMHRVYDFVHTL